MVNKLGKFSRKIRIENEERLEDMAKKLGVSSTFLSMVENGVKKPPKNWIEKFLSIYELDKKQEQEFRDCVFEAVNNKSIDLSSYSKDDRDLLLLFARKIKTINIEQKEQIENILNN